MSELVKAQGELLDDVTGHIKDAADYAEAGEQAVEKAVDIHEANRKKICGIICCLSCTALIFIILVSGVI